MIRVLIADDHKMFRHGLRALLATEPEIEVVGEAANGRDAVALARTLRPHVVIMDFAMPEMNGAQATRQLAGSYPGVKILALSMHADRRFVARVLRAGASGYLLKDDASEELLTAIRTVAAGESYMSPGASRGLVRGYLQLLEEASPGGAEALTPRESEVVQLLAEGNSSKVIARLLHISVKTVESHRKNAMDRLGLHTVAELTKYAIREGLTSLDR